MTGEVEVADESEAVAHVHVKSEEGVVSEKKSSSEEKILKLQVFCAWRDFGRRRS